MAPATTIPNNNPVTGVSNGHPDARKQGRTSNDAPETISSAGLIQMEYDYSAHK